MPRKFHKPVVAGRRRIEHLKRQGTASGEQSLNGSFPIHRLLGGLEPDVLEPPGQQNMPGLLLNAGDETAAFTRGTDGVECYIRMGEADPSYRPTLFYKSSSS
jgi:hypothetical protein